MEDENGLNPLATAAEAGDADIAITLLDKVRSSALWLGAVDKGSCMGCTAYWCAGMCALCLVFGSAMKQQWHTLFCLVPYTPQYVSWGPSCSCSALWVLQGADVNRREATRLITPLHVATYHDQAPMIRLLLDKGVQVRCCCCCCRLLLQGLLMGGLGLEAFGGWSHQSLHPSGRTGGTGGCGGGGCIQGWRESIKGIVALQRGAVG